jgi:hypothetical protein
MTPSPQEHYKNMKTPTLQGIFHSQAALKQRVLLPESAQAGRRVDG